MLGQLHWEPLVYVVWRQLLVNTRGGQNWTRKLKKQLEVVQYIKTLEIPHSVHPWLLKKKNSQQTSFDFATHGLPEEVVSDNGPHFTSTNFAEFTCKHGIKHILVPPYHPESSEAAESSVRVVKDALIKQVLDGTKGISMK